MNEQITIIGNSTGDAELRFTPKGVAVANLSIAVNHRKKDAQGNWVDDDTSWYRVAAFDKLAEYVAGNVAKGNTVIVTGRLKIRQYEDRNGGKREAAEITADDIGFSMSRLARQQARATQPAPATPTADPWQQPTTDTPPF